MYILGGASAHIKATGSTPIPLKVSEGIAGHYTSLKYEAENAAYYHQITFSAYVPRHRRPPRPSQSPAHTDHLWGSTAPAEQLHNRNGMGMGISGIEK